MIWEFVYWYSLAGIAWASFDLYRNNADIVEWLTTAPTEVELLFRLVYLVLIDIVLWPLLLLSFIAWCIRS